MADAHFTLPKVDPTGPHLVTAAQAIEEAAEARSTLSERKHSFLREVEAREATAKRGGASHAYNSIWSYKEAIFGSAGILSYLEKTFALIKEKKPDITLPCELVDSLLQTHEDIIADTVVEKREWQTDCYLDFGTKNNLPFFTGVPGAAEQAENRAAIQSSVAHQQNRLVDQKQQEQQKKEQHQGINKAGKRVRMSSETKNELKPKTTPERPHTARSNASIFSLKSEVSDDGRDSAVTTDYDRLPAELQPTILHYRRESTMPKMKQLGPQTRMEKMKAQEEKNKEMLAKKESAALSKLNIKLIKLRFCAEMLKDVSITS